MAETGGFSRGKSAIFRPWSRGFSTQAIDLAAFMSADFFGAREQKKCRAPFSGEDFVDVTRRGRVRPDAMDLMTCGRHGDAAQTATLPWRGMSHYFKQQHAGAVGFLDQQKCPGSAVAVVWRELNGRPSGSFELVCHSVPNGPSATVTHGLAEIYGSLRHSPYRKMSGTKWQLLRVFRATLRTDLQLGYQAVRRFPGGKQTTEVAAGSLARPSDEPHSPRSNASSWRPEHEP